MRHVASKCDFQRLHHKDPHVAPVCYGELKRNTVTTKNKNKSFDVHRVPHRPKGARAPAAVISSWSEHSWQRRVGLVRIVPEQKQQQNRRNRESEKRKKKRAKGGSSRANVGCQYMMSMPRKSDVRNLWAAERAAMPTCAFP